MTVLETRGLVIANDLDTRGHKVTNGLSSRGHQSPTLVYTPGIGRVEAYISYFTPPWDYPGEINDETSWPIHRMNVRTNHGMQWTEDDPNETSTTDPRVIGSATDVAYTKNYYESLGIPCDFHTVPELVPASLNAEADLVKSIIAVTGQMAFDTESFQLDSSATATDVDDYMSRIVATYPDAQYGCIFSWLPSERTNYFFSTWEPYMDYLIVAAYYQDDVSAGINETNVEAWLDNLRDDADDYGKPLVWLLYGDDATIAAGLMRSARK